MWFAEVGNVTAPFPLPFLCSGGGAASAPPPYTPVVVALHPVLALDTALAAAAAGLLEGLTGAVGVGSHTAGAGAGASATLPALMGRLPAVVSLAYLPASRSLAVAFDTGAIALWDAAHRRHRLRLPSRAAGYGAHVSAFARDDDWLLEAGGVGAGGAPPPPQLQPCHWLEWCAQVAAAAAAAAQCQGHRGRQHRRRQRCLGMERSG